MVKHYKINGIKVSDYGGYNLPLIFIHAFPLSSDMWKNQVRYFRSSCRIITYDIRGLGKSAMNDYQYTMENLADDLLNIISRLKLNNVILCGLSMGGYIILRTVLKQAKNIRAIILADTRAERDDNKGLISRSETIDAIKTGQIKRFKNDFLKKLISEENLRDKKLVNFINKMMSGQTSEGICAAIIAIATRINAIEHLNEIKVPALIIAGAQDELTPVKFARRMKSKIKNSELIIIPNSGHLTNLENPGFFNLSLKKFLDKVNRKNPKKIRP